jgi:hypothetical protein
MQKVNKRGLNYITLAIFAPILILAGIGGFMLPPGPMSAAPAYNIFHIIFGSVGLLLVLLRRSSLIRAFNVVFGSIDLYQALASVAGWFPLQYFQWKTADDVLHIVIGEALLAIALFAEKWRD